MNPLGNGHIQRPRHHNSRENHLRGSRSHPQFLSDFGAGGVGGSSSINRNRVTFPDLEEESIPERAIGILLAMAASICVFGLCTMLVILYVTVKPFSQSSYRRLAAQLGAASFLDALAILLPNIKIKLTGDSDVPSPVGTSMLVSNHLLDGDWWAVLMLGRCVGLRGSVKVFLRNEILHLSAQNAQSGGEQQQQQQQRTTPRVLSSSALASRSGHENNGSGGGGGGGGGGGTSSSTTATATASPHSSSSSSRNHHHTKHDLAMMAKLLHAFLDFPLVNGDDYISDREHLFQLLRSFAENSGGSAPVHLLFFPEGWSLHNGVDRRSILAKSNEFATREGRPQLKHLLLPRTTGFNASLECLRESSPVVYDVTMAYKGYDGSLPPSFELSLSMLWYMLRRQFPSEVHIRIKRYSMEEVLQDASWLDKKWAEKDRLLSHFSRHQTFPTDSRGFCRHREFDTRNHSLETSFVSLLRLLLLPCAVPFLLLLSVPLFWTVLWIWLIHRTFKTLFPDLEGRSSGGTSGGSVGGAGHTPQSRNSAQGTPFFPATPFVSPSVSNWRDMFRNHNDDTTQ